MKFDKIGTKPGEYSLVEVGEKFGPLHYPVTDHDIKAFAFTQDDYNPWCFSDNNPFGKRICQCAILANDLLRMFLTAYDPCKIVGLHTSEELWFCSPLYAGENVTLTGEYVDKYELRGKGYVVMQADARGEDGRVILRHRGTEIMKILGSSLTGKKEAKVEGDRVTGEYDETLPLQSNASVNIPVNSAITPMVKHTTAEQTQVFSGIGLHFINIHNTLKTAKEAGYENLVVQGQQQVCYLAEMLSNFFGSTWFYTGHLKVKMVHPVLVGDVLTFSGCVKSFEKVSEGTKCNLHIWGKNSAGEMTILGWADAVIPD